MQTDRHDVAPRVAFRHFANKPKQQQQLKPSGWVYMQQEQVFNLKGWELK
jgi:hypothetical protein